MQIFIFKGKKPNLYGFTPDTTGKNLPTDLGPWVLFKTTEVSASDVPRIAVSSQDIIKSVQEQGFHLGTMKIKTEVYVGGQPLT